MDEPILAGLDIGGTKIGVSIGTRDGRVLAHGRVATDPARTPEDLLGEALALLRTLETGLGSAPGALGMACPGPLSYAEGRLLEVPNMPRWQGFPVLGFAAERFAGPVAMMNDANAGVLAEWYWGAAHGATNAVFLTMSTGMGAGLLLDGRVYEGGLALAGEVGHIRLRHDGPVGFGKRGSVEGYCSGPGIVQMARMEALCFAQQGRHTQLAAGGISAERVCELARAGDAAAVAVIDRCAFELGRLCALLVDLLNPDVIVLGTIGSAWPDLFLDRARRVIDAEAIPAAARHVRLAPSGLARRGDQTALAIARRRVDQV